MRILIIGGTSFVGPALVEAALARGHHITLFNRGRSAPDAFPNLETIIGDRETDLERLQGRAWDAVIDTCGYLPRHLRLSTAALRGAVSHYTFISTLSVYPPAGPPNRAETAPVLTLDDETVEEVNAETYGPLKALCEAAVTQAFPSQSLLLRCGYIAGPRDKSGRLSYWLQRAADGGEAIAPPAQQPIQYIDVRDLADFTLRQTEAGVAGVYNVAGPARRKPFGELLAQVKAALDSDVRFYHVSDAFLRENEVAEFVGLPLWLSQPLAESFMTFNIDKALGAGLRFRPVAATARDTYALMQGEQAAEGMPGTLSAEKRALLLKCWKEISE